MLHLLTKIATWNNNRQSSYDGPISVCFHGYINLLRIIEPLAFMSIPDSLVAATLTNTADQVGYKVYLNKHSHTYIRETTLLT